jgi:integrase
VKYRLKRDGDLKERLYSLGPYPEVTLAQARAERARVRSLVRVGGDPVAARRVRREDAGEASARTVAAIATDWLEKRKGDWSDVHYAKSRRAIERDVLPALGKIAVADVTPVMVAKVIERIRNRGTEDRSRLDTAQKVLQHTTAIFRLAQARGWRADNPATPVTEELPKRRPISNRAAFLAFPPLGKLLRDLDRVHLAPATRLAHRLIAYTAVRINNALEAEWKEFDLDGEAPTWTIPRAKLKTKLRRFDHEVPLGPTIAAELREWQRLAYGTGRYLFPSLRDPSKPITHEALEKVLRNTLGLRDQHTVHGWRSSFSTLAKDAGHDPIAVDLALDHVSGSAVARAYYRGVKMPERLALYTWWDAHLTAAQQGR